METDTSVQSSRRVPWRESGGVVARRCPSTNVLLARRDASNKGWRRRNRRDHGCNREAALGSLKIALVFGYLGFLRVSNLAPYTCSEFDHTRHTTWEDIHPSRDGVLICLKWTKTRQAAPYTAPVPLSTLGSSELCPLTLWQDYVDRLSHLEISPQMPFWLTTGSPTGKWVTVPMLRIMMRRAAHLAGLSEFGYTPHGLRTGGASFSYLAGVPLDHIKFHGTWTSNAVEGYLVSQPRFNTPVAQAFKSLITP